jgi:hypothetical protein
MYFKKFQVNNMSSFYSESFKEEPLLADLYQSLIRISNTHKISRIELLYYAKKVLESDPKIIRSSTQIIIPNGSSQSDDLWSFRPNGDVKKRLGNQGKRWSKEHKKHLLSLVKGGSDIKNMSVELGRTEIGIISQLAKISREGGSINIENLNLTPYQISQFDKYRYKMVTSKRDDDDLLAKSYPKPLPQIPSKE